MTVRFADGGLVVEAKLKARSSAVEEGRGAAASQTLSATWLQLREDKKMSSERGVPWFRVGAKARLQSQFDGKFKLLAGASVLDERSHRAKAILVGVSFENRTTTLHVLSLHPVNGAQSMGTYDVSEEEASSFFDFENLENAGRAAVCVLDGPRIVAWRHMEKETHQEMGSLTISRTNCDEDSWSACVRTSPFPSCKCSVYDTITSRVETRRYEAERAAGSHRGRVAEYAGRYRVGDVPLSTFPVEMLKRAECGDGACEMAVALAGGACYALRPIAGKGSQVATSDKIFEFKVAEVLVDDFLGQGSDMILLISPAGRAALWDAGTDMIHGAFVKLKEHAGSSVRAAANGNEAALPRQTILESLQSRVAAAQCSFEARMMELRARQTYTAVAEERASSKTNTNHACVARIVSASEDKHNGVVSVLVHVAAEQTVDTICVDLCSTYGTMQTCAELRRDVAAGSQVTIAARAQLPRYGRGGGDPSRYTVVVSWSRGGRTTSVTVPNKYDMHDRVGGEASSSLGTWGAALVLIASRSDLRSWTAATPDPAWYFPDVRERSARCALCVSSPAQLERALSRLSSACPPDVRLLWDAASERDAAKCSVRRLERAIKEEKAIVAARSDWHHSFSAQAETDAAARAVREQLSHIVASSPSSLGR